MIKNFIDMKANDLFSLFRGLDLQELLFQIETYYLEYRNSLNLPKDVTFGLEIEYEDINKKKIDSYIEHNFPDWYSKTDGSLKNGGEINSPIMIDSPKYWNELKSVCDYLSSKRANMSCNAGGHIHVGSNVLDNIVEAWKIFLKLYMCYEHVLIRFLYGDKVNGRRSISQYAPPVSGALFCELNAINSAESMYDLSDSLKKFTRYFALNLNNVDYINPYNTYKNTIEFRSPNATDKAAIIQNNANALTKLCIVARNKIIDEKFLDYKIKHDFCPFVGNFVLYTTIDLKNALEFVDLIFDNNLDKVYFLRQYLKGFVESYQNSEPQKAKIFVR